MLPVPDDIQQRLRRFDQEHVLRWWDELTDDERKGLLQQLADLDLELLQRLYQARDASYRVPDAERIRPVPVVRTDAEEVPSRARGEAALRRGEVAVLVVAGGQGSRLGFDKPKGMFPIGPVTDKSLFKIHAEKVLALRRRYGHPIPFLLMTSHATHEDTQAFFADHGYFGLPREEVHFFCQGTMPALDLETGKLLMESRGRLFTSPDGHGGLLAGLQRSHLLDLLMARGIRQVFYFQVDNPLVKVADPAYLGHHLAAGAEVSLKIVPKEGPRDKLGNVVLVDGRCTIIEYSDLPHELARQEDEAGRLRIWAGSPAIHFFDVAFLERMTRGGTQIPFHVARKKVPYLDASGGAVQPARENALKFEKFIFDVLPLADRWVVVETSRAEEFMPLKNATGPDSPDTVRRAMSDLAAGWLRKAGVEVPPSAGPVEISPLFALDAAELAEKVRPTLRIEGPTYLEE